jgi:hypothetical protein
MADQPDITAPGQDPTPGAQPSESTGTEAPQPAESKRRHRALVWSLVVLASVLLTVSITANWVQRELLDTDQVVNTTDEILDDEDVQEALSTYTVDQLFANVDVQGQIEERLPSSAQALAIPAAAAARQVAVNVQQRALASPRVQDLVSGAIGRAHGRFVRLIRSEGEYVSTTGGEVTLQYGSIIADLAARLGLDPATISKIQDVVQGFSQDLKQGLTTAQTEIKSVRADLSQVQAGELSPEQQQNLGALQQKVSDLQGTIASLHGKIADAQGSVPSQLQGRLGKLEDRLSDVEARLTAMNKQIDAVLKDPSQANVDTLDSRLATLEARITDLLGRPVVQNPGELVLLKSNQLDGIQTIVRALRNLGFVLPLLVLLMYVGAIYLAKGWRREALIAAGGGILAATLLVLVARRLIGSAVVDSLASSQTVEPAIRSVWEIVSGALRATALFVLVIGLAFIGGGLVAGPGRHALAVRRFLAPYFRDHPVAVYAVAAVLFLLWLAFIPGINNLGQVLVIVALAALAIVGIELLRRQTAQEFPPGPP